MAQIFNEQKKTKTDVFTNERSMGKLFKEAEKLKKVLSANNAHFAQVGWIFVNVLLEWYHFQTLWFLCDNDNCTYCCFYDMYDPEVWTTQRLCDVIY